MKNYFYLFLDFLFSTCRTDLSRRVTFYYESGSKFGQFFILQRISCWYSRTLFSLFIYKFLRYFLVRVHRLPIFRLVIFFVLDAQFCASLAVEKRVLASWYSKNYNFLSKYRSAGARSASLRPQWRTLKTFSRCEFRISDVFGKEDCGCGGLKGGEVATVVWKSGQEESI